MIFALFIAIASAGYIEDRQCVVNCSRAQFGKPYVWGDEGPDTFDCAGLVMYCYDQCGHKLEGRPTTKSLLRDGTAIDRENLVLADLVFPTEAHVQIYSGNGNIIHAPKTGDVVKEQAIYKWYSGRRYIMGPDSEPTYKGGSVKVTCSSLTIKQYPHKTSSKVGTKYKGNTIKYDSIYKNEEGKWLSYVNRGCRRYIMAKTSGGKCYVSPCP